MSRHNKDYSITTIGHNTEKSPGDFKKPAVTQSLKKDHQLMLVGKNSQRTLIIIISLLLITITCITHKIG